MDGAPTTSAFRWLVICASWGPILPMQLRSRWYLKRSIRPRGVSGLPGPSSGGLGLLNSGFSRCNPHEAVKTFLEGSSEFPDSRSLPDLTSQSCRVGVPWSGTGLRLHVVATFRTCTGVASSRQVPATPPHHTWPRSRDSHDVACPSSNQKTGIGTQ